MAGCAEAPDHGPKQKPAICMELGLGAGRISAGAAVTRAAAFGFCAGRSGQLARRVAYMQDGSELHMCIAAVSAVQGPAWPFTSDLICMSSNGLSLILTSYESPASFMENALDDDAT